MKQKPRIIHVGATEIALDQPHIGRIINAKLAAIKRKAQASKDYDARSIRYGGTK